MPALHLVISGRVQGVGYRAWFEAEAVAAGLSGWVRNRRDGTVEAVIAGDDDAVARMTGAARRGPSSAVVREVAATSAEPPPAGFRVLPTA